MDEKGVDGKQEDIFQMIYESYLGSKLEQILVKLVKDLPSQHVEDSVKTFLFSCRHANENFWKTFYDAKTHQDRLECYYQFAKNQCTATEKLIEDLSVVLDDEKVKENLNVIMKEGFTF